MNELFLCSFKTLINPNMNKYGSEYTTDYRPGSG